MNDEGQSYHSGEIPKVLRALCQEPETNTKCTSYTTTIHSSKHLLIQQTLSHLRYIYIYTYIYIYNFLIIGVYLLYNVLVSAAQ